jgi:hypothetical protein
MHNKKKSFKRDFLNKVKEIRGINLNIKKNRKRNHIEKTH